MHKKVIARENEKNLKNKEIEALIVNSGNANTFTGQAGINALTKISNFVSNKFKVSVKKVFFASTGVIGEKFPENKILNTLIFSSSFWSKMTTASSQSMIIQTVDFNSNSSAIRSEIP